MRRFVLKGVYASRRFLFGARRWLGPQAPEACLVGGIDDATSICPYGEFFAGEDTLAVLSVLKRTVMCVGIPEVLYVDQASHFGKANTRFQFLDWEKHLSHVERAMAELGCRVLFAPSPQAKGQIERTRLDGSWSAFHANRPIELKPFQAIKKIPA